MANPYIIIEDFRAGLDVRRISVTSPAGSVQILDNGHITRGGEIEKAQAFRKVFESDTDDIHGLLATPDGFLVFGSEDITGNYPDNVLLSNPPIRYQQLTAGSAVMHKVLSAELYDGIPYVIADYDDGVVRHFYDGTDLGITQWHSDQGRAAFIITGTSDDLAAAASGSFNLTGGTAGSDELSALTVGGSSLISAAVTFDSGDSIEQFIDKVILAINSYTGTSGWQAELSGGKIKITSVLAGTLNNSLTIAGTVTGTLSFDDAVSTSGGSDASQITALQVNGSDVIDTAIDYAGSDYQTAKAIVAAIRNYSATSGYTAVNYGTEVFIIHEAGGTAVNGHAVDITLSGSLTSSPSSGITIENGSATATVYEPGRYAKTIDAKMYVLSGSVMHYSAIDDPTDFTTGTGYGFDNLSTNASGSEELQAMARYFENAAIFSEGNIHIWTLDADPAQNLEIQVLNNTGTIAPKSVTEYGDNDVFYLSESGVRSLRARDSSNAAFVNDVGVAIDTLVQAKIKENIEDGIEAAAVLEPKDSRYMIAVSDNIFVFSFFPTSKVSAWSVYKPGFTVDDWAFSGQIVLCKTGNSIYRYGGETEDVYDPTQMKVVLPFLDASDPATNKTWLSLDIACLGTFDVYAAYNVEDDLEDDDSFTYLATIKNSSYSKAKIPITGRGSHIALKFVSKNNGQAKLGNAIIHYKKGSTS